MINYEVARSSFGSFHNAEPYRHCVIDDFLEADVATAVSKEFPQGQSVDYNGRYDNQIEYKFTCNIWDKFLPNTYRLLTELNSTKFIDFVSEMTGCKKLYPDVGLHGGGQHSHTNGGILNPHLDYNVHPKLGLQRKFNLIIYLTKDWQESWGGEFGLWSSKTGHSPDTLIKKVQPKFNRAVFFDTTQNSWHGLASRVSTPDSICRNSLALYYLTDPPQGTAQRKRALFAALPEQKNDKTIEDLISRRNQINGDNVESWSRK